MMAYLVILCLVLLCQPLHARFATGGLTITVTADASVPEGMSASVLVRVDNSTAACDTLLLWPFLNGSQWGAEIVLSAQCTGISQLPIPNVGASALQVALLAEPYFDTMWTVGEDVPVNYLIASSNTVVIQGVANVHLSSRRAGTKSSVRFVMYWEPWFTPHNMNWGMAEAIPLVGRYSSIGLLGNSSKSAALRNVVKQHCLWFNLVGITAIGIDWTNNLWSIPTWAERGVYAQELINATYETLAVYSSLQKAGYEVPEFVLLLGLDNGPQATIPALNGELEWVTQTLLNNPDFSPLFIRDIEGKPLMVLFDGGDIHSKVAPLQAANYTLRYMSSQFQINLLNRKGFYSWMDGTIAPLPTKSPYDPQVTEALTITNAFFADGGWLAPDARSTANGATLLEEAWVAVQTRPQLLFLCQWNEYAGQPSPAPSYVDIYNATFGNDMEPTSLSACGLVSRPDNAYCGGWGFRYLNILRGLRHILDADMRIVEQQSLLVVVKHPVPWLAVSRGEDLVVTFVTLGRCQNLGYFTILVDNSTSPISVPAKSMDDVQYAHTVSSSVLQALAPGWHELHVFGHKHDSQMCPASVLLSDDSLSLQSAHTRDKVRFQLF